MKAIVLLLAFAVALPVKAAAEQPDRYRLIGTPIYSSDGAEIGTIADVRLDEGGRLSSLRIDASARLGFGTRQVEIPGRAVTIVRGVAVLGRLPEDARASEGARTSLARMPTMPVVIGDEETLRL